MQIEATVIEACPHAPWLVFIHGFGGNRATWRRQISRFRRQYRILALDLPGHGESQHGISQENASLEQVAAAILKLLHSHGITQADFICLSLGTMVLCAICHLEPQMVRCAVLCGAIMKVGWFSQLQLWVGGILKYLLPYRAMMRLFATALMPLPSHRVPREYLVRECGKLGQREFHCWYRLFCREIHYISRNAGDLPAGRTLVIMGAQDYAFGRGARLVCSQLPGVRLQVMEHCGHVCNLQRPGEFSELARSFFEQAGALQGGADAE